MFARIKFPDLLQVKKTQFFIIKKINLIEAEEKKRANTSFIKVVKEFFISRVLSKDELFATQILDFLAFKSEFKDESMFKKSDIERLVKVSTIAGFLRSLKLTDINDPQFDGVNELIMSIFSYTYDISRYLDTQEQKKLFYMNVAEAVYYYAYPLAVRYRGWENVFQIKEAPLASVQEVSTRRNTLFTPKENKVIKKASSCPDLQATHREYKR